MAGRVTLDELYVLVPSAEDYDLAEEAQVERLHAWLVREYAALLGRAEDDPLPGAPAPADATATPDATDAPESGEEADPACRPTDAQALGCLEHLLGARVVPPDAEGPATPPDGPTGCPTDRPTDRPTGGAEDPAG